MEKQKLLFETLIANQERLQKYLIEIETVRQTDIIAYYGVIEEHIVEHFFLEIAKKLQKKSNRTKLTIILTSVGGDNFGITQFKKITSIYQEIDFIIPSYAFSTGTIVSFLGNTIFINPTRTEFSAIDPQINVLPETEQKSVFHYFKSWNCEYKLIDDTEEIDHSFQITDPPNPDLLNTFLCHKGNLFNLRQDAFAFLVNHNLQNHINKKRKSIEIINRLMDVVEFPKHNNFHNNLLIELGLTIKPYTGDEQKGLEQPIEQYHSLVSEFVNIQSQASSDKGNMLNCFIQSKLNYIY